MSTETALTGWALALAYALPVGLVIALIAQTLRSRAERRRADAAEAAILEAEASLGQMKARPDEIDEDANNSGANGAG